MTTIIEGFTPTIINKLTNISYYLNEGSDDKVENEQGAKLQAFIDTLRNGTTTSVDYESNKEVMAIIDDQLHKNEATATPESRALLAAIDKASAPPAVVAPVAAGKPAGPTAPANSTTTVQPAPTVATQTTTVNQAPAPAQVQPAPATDNPNQAYTNLNFDSKKQRQDFIRDVNALSLRLGKENDVDDKKFLDRFVTRALFADNNNNPISFSFNDTDTDFDSNGKALNIISAKFADPNYMKASDGAEYTNILTQINNAQASHVAAKSNSTATTSTHVTDTSDVGTGTQETDTAQPANDNNNQPNSGQKDQAAAANPAAPADPQPVVQHPRHRQSSNDVSSPSTDKIEYVGAGANGAIAHKWEHDFGLAQGTLTEDGMGEIVEKTGIDPEERESRNGKVLRLNVDKINEFVKEHRGIHNASHKDRSHDEPALDTETAERVKRPLAGRALDTIGHLFTFSLGKHDPDEAYKPSDVGSSGKAANSKSTRD